MTMNVLREGERIQLTDPNPHCYVASFTYLDMYGQYQFSPKLSLQFNANNLLDRKYYVLDQYDNTYYGAPANYSVTLRAAY